MILRLDCNFFSCLDSPWTTGVRWLPAIRVTNTSALKDFLQAFPIRGKTPEPHPERPAPARRLDDGDHDSHGSRIRGRSHCAPPACALPSPTFNFNNDGAPR